MKTIVVTNGADERSKAIPLNITVYLTRNLLIWTLGDLLHLKDIKISAGKREIIKAVKKYVRSNGNHSITDFGGDDEQVESINSACELAEKRVDELFPELKE